MKVNSSKFTFEDISSYFFFFRKSSLWQKALKTSSALVMERERTHHLFPLNWAGWLLKHWLHGACCWQWHHSMRCRHTSTSKFLLHVIRPLFIELCLYIFTIFLLLLWVLCFWHLTFSFIHLVCKHWQLIQIIFVVAISLQRNMDQLTENRNVIEF